METDLACVQASALPYLLLLQPPRDGFRGDENMFKLIYVSIDIVKVTEYDYKWVNFIIGNLCLLKIK